MRNGQLPGNLATLDILGKVHILRLSWEVGEVGEVGEINSKDNNNDLDREKIRASRHQYHVRLLQLA